MIKDRDIAGILDDLGKGLVNHAAADRAQASGGSGLVRLTGGWQRLVDADQLPGTSERYSAVQLADRLDT
ncbi:hypothetical protein HFC70_19650 [Agrobacterium sp. a22-2]|uniref:hypothetical protein n=1 Tax=Agrobacterium sp. a22-2 TaxID=2283840 RepID=UPI00144692D7|nr:hypothetical protein [Agrobacterium sp. a22-2]NKN38569.1 hypothetical protein [Agrobacterium sp. a22-2]